MSRPTFEQLPIDTISGTVFLDVDGTLVPDKTKDLSDTITQKIRILSGQAQVYLTSNGSYTRSEELAGLTGVKALAGRKPFLRIDKQKVPGQRVVIGDKYLTDGISAKILGAQFIHVERVKNGHESFFARASYLLDDVVSVCASFVVLARPWQWVKNFLVFAPILFAADLFNTQALSRVSLTFIIFCLSSSAIYVINDIYDRNRDRLHPRKKFRPLVSGEISIAGAVGFALVLVIVATALLVLIPQLAGIVFGYIVLNILYSVWLKHAAVVDIFSVAASYVLRIIAGGIAAAVPLSPWIILCVLFGALFAIIGKRRAEFVNVSETSRRVVLENYSNQALDYMLSAAAAVALMSYGVYSVVGHDNLPYLVYSTIFVAFVLFRMLNRMYTHPEDAETPELLVFRDPWILSGFVLWLLFVFLVFYIH